MRLRLRQRLCRSGSLVGLGGLALALECGPRTDDAARYLSAVTAVEGPLENALRQFDAASARDDLFALRKEARGAVEAARLARDLVEGMPVSPSLTAAWREELLYLNHVVAAFQSFSRGDGGAAERERVRSILQRGRTHQRRGREVLR